MPEALRLSVLAGVARAAAQASPEHRPGDRLFIVISAGRESGWYAHGYPPGESRTLAADLITHLVAVAEMDRDAPVGDVCWSEGEDAEPVDRVTRLADAARRAVEAAPGWRAADRLVISVAAPRRGMEESRAGMFIHGYRGGAAARKALAEDLARQVYAVLGVPAARRVPAAQLAAMWRLAPPQATR